MKRNFVWFGALMIGCAAVWACSGDDTGTDAGQDAGNDATTTDSGGQDSGGQDATGNDAATTDSGSDATASDSGTDSGGDAGLVNGCTTFVDMTADGGVITGPNGPQPSQYQPNCVHIKTGQSVTWNSKFSNHPLQPSGGTTPTPITLTNTGTTVTFSFPNAGTFGYHCQVHPGMMFGAVEVTP